MSASLRTETQSSEILQDSFPSDSSLDGSGEILTFANSPNTLKKMYRWIGAIAKSIIGSTGARRGATRINGGVVQLTGLVTSSGNVVTGSSTLFLSELQIGSFIAGPLNEFREILAITNDTSLTLVSAFSSDIVTPAVANRLPTVAERLDAIEKHVNAVINSDFDYWQRGSSFTTPASLAFTADRHQVEYDGSIGAFTVSRQNFALGQTDVPDEPRYFYRWDQTGAGSGQTVKRINHKIEGVRSFAGKTIQVKFYAKSNAVSSITVGAIQNFGTGGSPSSEVVVTAKSRSLSTSWQVFIVELVIPSITGKTIGNDENDYLNICFNLPLNATHTFDLAHWQIYEGTSNKKWIRYADSKESESIALIRFYKAYNYAAGTLINLGNIGSSTVQALFQFTFHSPMRAAPTVTTSGGTYTNGDFQAGDFVTVANVASISAGSTDKNGVQLLVSLSSALTSLNPAQLSQVSSTTILAFDAELP
jgi:hypothetical protein